VAVEGHLIHPGEDNPMADPAAATITPLKINQARTGKTLAELHAAAAASGTAKHGERRSLRAAGAMPPRGSPQRQKSMRSWKAAVPALRPRRLSRDRPNHARDVNRTASPS
jgi:hypothetical protein